VGTTGVQRFGYENVGDFEAQFFNLRQSSNGLQTLMLLLIRLFFIAFVTTRFLFIHYFILQFSVFNNPKCSQNN